MKQDAGTLETIFYAAVLALATGPLDHLIPTALTIDRRPLTGGD